MKKTDAAGLNPAQKHAVACRQGPCLVLAGAGSGKTRVIAHKIAALLDAGVAAESIAAITFTNKAAAEMRRRTRALAGAAAGPVLICTFHALGVRLLRADGQALGLKPQFSILDSADSLGLIRDCGGGADRASARRWQWAISGWKAAGLDAGQALSRAGDETERQAARVMQLYQERLTAYQSVDFDDLIALPLRLLSGHEEVRRKWQQCLAYVLVDEYQDTSASQYQLLKLLLGPEPDFTVVGDDNQSIYGWRGATLENLVALPHDFPGLQVIKLEENYRSTGAILEAANRVIGHNPALYEKRLRSNLGEGEPVRVLACDHEAHEAERILARIQSLQQRNPRLQWKDFAVLYRANHQSRVLEQVLRQAQVPYRVSGGQSFFDRAEIRDLCAWLRLWVNEDDDPAFLRAATTPKRGIGHQTLARLGEFASQQSLSLFGALFQHSLHAVLPRRSCDHLVEFGREVNDWRYRAEHARGSEAARAVLSDWLQEIGYERHLHDSSDSAAQAQARWGHVLEFCDWIAGRCGGAGAPEAAAGERVAPVRSLLEAAQTIALVVSLRESGRAENVVTLSTLHAAKGLEWSHVMLAGVVEGLLPFLPEEDEGDVAERIVEERRLMYVGITRARHSLAVSWVRRRKRGRKMVPAKASRFIAEMALQQKPGGGDARARLQALRAEFARRAAEPQVPEAAS